MDDREKDSYCISLGCALKASMEFHSNFQSGCHAHVVSSSFRMSERESLVSTSPDHDFSKDFKSLTLCSRLPELHSFILSCN